MNGTFLATKIRSTQLGLGQIGLQRQVFGKLLEEIKLFTLGTASLE